MFSNETLYRLFIEKVREVYGAGEIQLHRPVFSGNELLYLSECITSNFVSSVGSRVNEFEETVSNFVGSKKAIACVNGTSALHVALHSIGVKCETQVLTQALTFVATANAISYCGAEPVFIDVDSDTLGMSPEALRVWLQANTSIKNKKLINKNSGKEILACLPMHTFGFPCRIKEISEICYEYGIQLIEDAAESLGSYFNSKHTGTFGRAGIFSFNGNKIITTGGGGLVVTDDEELAVQIKHLTTTAKKPHAYDYFHDEVGFNYRMPNINAAIGVAQIEKLPDILKEKADVAKIYSKFFEQVSINFIRPLNKANANNWLNAIILNDQKERDSFLQVTNNNGILTRPIWNLLSELPMYKKCENDGLSNSRWLVERVVNIPSSVPNLG